MKNVFKQIGFVAIIANYRRRIFAAMFVAIMGLTFATPVNAGGIVDRVFGGGAKNLAKQTLDLTKKAADIEKKAAELQAKAAELEEKTAALSDRDRRTFREELARLNVGGPEWLFSDAPGLLGGAEDIAADNDTGNAAGNGILGGLAGLIRGLGGDNNSGASSSPTTAPSSSGTTAPPTTAPASSGTTAPSTPAATGSGNILGGRTGAFFSMFDGKNYHMKARTNFQGTEVVTETYIKGDMVASVSEMMGMSTRSVQRDNMTYIIMDTTKTYMVIPTSASSGNPSEEPIRTSGLVMTGSGTARFDGRNLPYEEYSITSEGYTVRMQWFLDGNNLAGIRTITIDMTIDMVILALDQNVPNSVFEIPAGYQRMEMPGGY